MTDHLWVREIDDEGPRLVRILRWGSGVGGDLAAARLVVLSAQTMDVPAIARIAFTGEHQVRECDRRVYQISTHFYRLSELSMQRNRHNETPESRARRLTQAGR